MDYYSATFGITTQKQRPSWAVQVGVDVSGLNVIW